MRSLNFLTLSGVLREDPIEDKTQRVGPIAQLLLEVNDGGPAEQSNRALVVPIVVFGKRAARCLDRLEAGSRIVVHGRLVQNSDKGLSVFGDWIEFCLSPRRGPYEDDDERDQ